jgi:hypothetical protein
VRPCTAVVAADTEVFWDWDYLLAGLPQQTWGVLRCGWVQMTDCYVQGGQLACVVG